MFHQERTANSLMFNNISCLSLIINNGHNMNKHLFKHLNEPNAQGTLRALLNILMCNAFDTTRAFSEKNLKK